jgi:hypothetical protein
MSSFFLWLLPEDPWYQPAADAAERARRRLASYVQPQADGETSAQFQDKVEFLFGMGFKDVRCPHCGAGAMEWWAQALGAWLNRQSEDPRATLDTTAGCCGAAVSLNDLDYNETAGFASFYLQVREPNGADLRPQQRAVLEEIIGCKLRKMWAHV